MRIKIRFILLALVSFIISCGVNAGGNEVPNMIKGNVTNSSIPLANTTVNIQNLRVNATGNCFDNKYVTKTDSKGNFEVEVEESGLYTVVAEDSSTNTKAILNEIEVTPNKTSQISLNTEKTISLTGRISRNKITDPKVLYVFIPGTNYKADSVDGNGFYTFKNIPQGTYSIAYTYGNEGTIIKVKTKISNSDSLFIKDLPFVGEIDSLLTPFTEYSNGLNNLYYVTPIEYNFNTPFWYQNIDFSGVEIYDYKESKFININNIDTLTNAGGENKILLDDFENNYGDAPNQNAFAAKIGLTNYPTETYKTGGWWYTYSDKDKDGGNSSVYPNPSESNDFSPLIINDKNSYKSKSLHVKFILNDGAEYPFAGIGFLIYGQENNYHDLSKMTKFTFWAKGKGKVRVKFFSKYVDETLKDKGHFGKNIELTNEWELYEINSVDITPQEGSKTAYDGKKWTDVNKEINKIHFETSPKLKAGDTVDLYLDDINIYGLNQQKLIESIQ